MPIATAVMLFLGALPDLIKVAEKAFSGKKGSGKAKKKLAMKTITTSVGVAIAGKKITKAKGKKILAEAGALVDMGVNLANAVDALKK